MPDEPLPAGRPADESPPSPGPRPAGALSRAAVFVAMAALGLVVGAAAAALVLVRFVLPSASTSQVAVTPTPNVVVAVRDLARLETANYHMERVVELTDEQTHLFGLVQSKDALVLVAVGDVVAGVDLSKLREEDVVADWATRTIRVHAPAPEVFSATLDNARTHVVTRSTDRLATRREDLEGRARQDAEARLKSAAIEAGILTRAQGGGDRELESLLRSFGFERIQIQWAEP